MAGDTGEEEGDDERLTELQTVTAIYPELRIDSTNAAGTIFASIDLAVEPLNPLLISFPSADGARPGELSPPESAEDNFDSKASTQEQEDFEAQESHRISYLPPLTLRIALPEGYPSMKPPVFFLESQNSWLPQSKLKYLRQAGHTLWEEMAKSQVIFEYIDKVLEAAGQGFGIGEDEEEGLNIPPNLKLVLLDFDLKAKRAKFEQETFACGICLEPKKGSVCHRLQLCSHVFCVNCLQEYYKSSITEGDVGNVKCMAPDCGLEERRPRNESTTSETPDDVTLEPSELLQIPLDQEIVQRYIRLKRKKRLESDPSTVYCPRKWCQGPARCPNKKENKNTTSSNTAPEPRTYDKNTNQDVLPPPSERLAICEDCGYAFCSICEAGWHGEYNICFPRSQFELNAEEKKSEEYMMLHTQACPTCNARAQKTHGCNHMICSKCNTHFCYLCGFYLDKGNPYQHYNTMKSPCWMRLWELEGGDDGEFGQAFAGGGLGLDIDAILQEDELEGDDVEEVEEPLEGLPILPAPRPNGNNRGGLRRALQMIRDDEEDEWDSDDMDDDEDDFDEFGA